MCGSQGTRRGLCLVAGGLLSLGLAVPVSGQDKSGVTPNTISLPKGPGSVEGLGESFQPTLNTGTAKYGITLRVPPGPAGHAPTVTLSYEGGRSNGMLGYGWALAIAFIQRQTDKGIPRYVDTANGIDDDGDGIVDEADEVDRFTTDSGEELVPTADGSFFWKNESAFVRYRRVLGTCSIATTQSCLGDPDCPAAQTCSGFHWEGTLPDGTRQEFGVSAHARVSDAATGHVFKWLLERVTDTHGNTIVYTYGTFDGPENLNERYPVSISYGPGTPPWDSFHFVVFNYEARQDWFEDGRAGFLCRTGMRLREAVVGTQGPTPAGHVTGDFNGDGTPDVLDRTYELSYDGDPFWSVLTSVTQLGADGVSSLPPMRLAYTAAVLPDTISAANGIVGSVNTPLQLMDTGLTDLVDLNGDGLPDLLKTDAAGGAHTAYLNQGESNGAIAWANGVDVGGDQQAWALNLQSGMGAIAHLADMDGDGLSDFTSTSAVGDVFYFPNLGTVSWGDRVPMNVDPSDSAPPSPFGSPNVKTADIDFDKRMDIIQSVSNGFGADYRIWFNLGGGQYAKSVTVPQDNGVMLSDPGVQIADINGDRVPDIAQLRPTELQVLAGLGYGHFAPPVTMVLPNETFDMDQVKAAKLEDINGDGLVDLVLERAAPGELWYWINLGNYTFDHRRVITGMPAPQGVQPAIRWADMNGNGTTDLVYADQFSDPRLQTVDIGRLMGAVPRPHMLARVENGIGRVNLIGYRTSSDFAVTDAQAGHPWPYPLPFPVNVVSSVQTQDGLGHTYTTEFQYHDGYYDGTEKEFRGFGRVERIEVGDDSAPTLITKSEFDTGRLFEGMKGNLLRATTEQEDGSIFSDETTSWTVPPIQLYAGTDGRAVHFTHPTGTVRLIEELGQGTERRLETETTYDSYGNITRHADYGIVDGGDRSAGNDERITTTDYAINADAWLIHEPQRTEVQDGNGVAVSRSEFYYDDDAFSGNNLGQVTVGDLTMKREWINPADPSAFVMSSRTMYDTYGNAVAMLDPLAVGGNQSFAAGHARTVAYDGGLHTYPTTETVYVGGGNPPLVFHATFDEGFGIPTSSVDFNGNGTTFGYDTFARLINIVRPGDTADLPTSEYAYALAVPFGGSELVNYVESRQLDRAQGGGGDKRGHYFVSRHFSDGLGRDLMTKMEAGAETVGGPVRVTVERAVQFNARVQPARTLNPYYTALSGSLDDQLAFESIEDPGWMGTFSVDGGLVSLGLGAAHQTTTRYDATLRELEAHNADGTVRRLSYEPLLTRVSDEDDSDASSPHADTPTVQYQDGLGRLVRIDEITHLNDDGTTGGTPHTWTTLYQYDVNDQLLRVTDAQSNVKSIAYDGLKRKTAVSDPDRGSLQYVYDSASNLIQSTDAKGQSTTYTYDGVNRMLGEDYHDDDQPFSGHHTFNPHQSITPTNRPDVAYFYDAPQTAVDAGDGTTVTGANTKGQLAYVWDLSGEEHLSYDARGRKVWSIKRVRDPLHGRLVSYRTGFLYDSIDRLQAVTYPDGDQVQYEYNDRNTLARILGGSNGTIVSDIAYWPSDQHQRIEYGNGVRTTYAYDSRLRLTALTTTNPQLSTDLIDFAYTFDGVSNIQSIVDRRPADAVPAGDHRRNTQTFQYDDLYRLTHVQYSFAPAGGAGSDGDVSYRYDRIGNRLAQVSSIDQTDNGLPVANLGQMESGGALGRSNRTGRAAGDPPGPHALTAIINPTAGTRAYTYDDNGNMSQLDGMTATWDFKDRLAALENTSMRAEYTYDYADRRITKQVTPKQTGGAAQDPTVVLYPSKYFEVREFEAPTKYVWNENTLVAHVTGSLSANVRVQRLRVVAGWNLASLAVTADNAGDQLRAPLADGSGVVEAVYVWDPQARTWHDLPSGNSAPAGAVLWIKSTAGATLQVTGTYTGPSTAPTARPQGDFFPAFGLEAWNLGAPFSLPGNATLWRFDKLEQAWQATLAPPASPFTPMPPAVPPGEAFFARSDAPAILTPPDPALGIRFYHQDHLGSTSVMTDAAGVAIEESATYPFGATRVRYAPRGVEDPYQFAQKERDPESGLDVVGARYYSATLGRFASVEPMALQGADLRKPSVKLNSYAYATNNPINFIDPTGHDDKSLNQKVAEFAQGNVGKKAVGKGECWDLGEEALKSAGAQTSKDLTPNFGPDADYVWGTPVKDLKNLEPGDILQFRDHMVTITRETTYKFKDETEVTKTQTEDHRRGGIARQNGTIPGHTAIVNGRVDANGAVQVAEQHVRGSHRVETSLLNTADVPPVVTETIGRAYNPTTKKMESAKITTTVTVSVTGSVWAYKPKAK